MVHLYFEKTMDPQVMAGNILKRAVAFDMEGKYTQALCLYQEGIEVLMEILKSTQDESRKAKYRSKISEYMDRGEAIKRQVEELKASGKFREQIQIKEGETGFSYSTIFSQFLTPSITSVEIDDPYISAPHQCDNFSRFVELCVKRCPALRCIRLITKKDDNDFMSQSKRLKIISDSLKEKNGGIIQVEFSDSLHDREIRLTNGWMIKIGRGLDYFKKSDRFSVGYYDFDLRPCKETTVDIFHRKELIK